MIEYYENPETIPYRRYQRFCSLLASENETGDNFSSLDKRVSRSIAYIASDERQAAINELSNLRMALHNVSSEIGLKGLAAAVMVKSIDGVPCDDISIEGLQKTLDKLSELGVSKKDIDDTTSDLKKKSNFIWNSIFRIFSRGKTSSLTLL